MTIKPPVAFLVFCALAFATHASAQELPPVPAQLDVESNANLNARRNSLIDREVGLRKRASDHNQRCKGVSSGSATAATCAARQDSISAAAIELNKQKDQFRTTIAEINKLIEEETALSKSIKTSLDQMRTMLNEMIDPSEEQLGVFERLREDLKKFTSRRFEVRRAMAVAAVRG